MAFGSSVLTHKKEQQIKIAGEFKPTVDCLCAIRRGFVAVYKDNVEFPGWIRNEQKKQYLREADIFLLPSYNEGMPMAILDAMGCGLPIVSTDVGGIPKIVRQGI